MISIKELYKKYSDLIPYLFFGVCTTIVNVGIYWLFSHLLKQKVMVSTVVAWVLAVFFAYITNRKWVFHSESSKPQEIFIEIVKFFSARIATGIVDWLCMFIFVDLINYNDVIIKALANVLVIFLNYVASRYVIFRKK